MKKILILFALLSVATIHINGQCGSSAGWTAAVFQSYGMDVTTTCNASGGAAWATAATVGHAGYTGSCWATATTTVATDCAVVGVMLHVNSFVTATADALVTDLSCISRWCTTYSTTCWPLCGTCNTGYVLSTASTGFISTVVTTPLAGICYPSNCVTQATTSPWACSQCSIGFSLGGKDAAIINPVLASQTATVCYATYCSAQVATTGNGCATCANGYTLLATAAAPATTGWTGTTAGGANSCFPSNCLTPVASVASTTAFNAGSIGVCSACAAFFTLATATTSFIGTTATALIPLVGSCYVLNCAKYGTTALPNTDQTTCAVCAPGYALSGTNCAALNCGTIATNQSDCSACNANYTIWPLNATTSPMYCFATGCVTAAANGSDCLATSNSCNSRYTQSSTNTQICTINTCSSSTTAVAITSTTTPGTAATNGPVGSCRIIITNCTAYSTYAQNQYDTCTACATGFVLSVDSMFCFPYVPGCLTQAGYGYTPSASGGAPTFTCTNCSGLEWLNSAWTTLAADPVQSAAVTLVQNTAKTACVINNCSDAPAATAAALQGGCQVCAAGFYQTGEYEAGGAYLICQTKLTCTDATSVAFPTGNVCLNVNCAALSSTYWASQITNPGTATQPCGTCSAGYAITGSASTLCTISCGSAGVLNSASTGCVSCGAGLVFNSVTSLCAAPAAGSAAAVAATNGIFTTLGLIMTILISLLSLL